MSLTLQSQKYHYQYTNIKADTLIETFCPSIWQYASQNHCQGFKHCHSKLCICSMLCILDAHQHICSLCMLLGRNTSTAPGRLHWLQASQTTEVSTRFHEVLGKSIPTHQEGATIDLALWCSPSDANLVVLLFSCAAVEQPWLEVDLTFDALCG